MVARAWATDARKSSKSGVGNARDTLRDTPQPRTARPAAGVEEKFVQTSEVSLCFLVNRRARIMRVVDFRAGPTPQKRRVVLEVARREGVEKVFTLVERDEVGTWMKLGFSREANVPGFYKRSDAFILGCVVADAAASDARAALVATPDDDDDLEVDDAPSAAQERAEKTVVAAKKQAKALLDRQLPQVKLTSPGDQDVKKAVERAVRTGRALTAFEPFGRDVSRRHLLVTARGGFELVASIESQACFGNAFLELLTTATTEAARFATVSALSAICDRLMAEGVVSCFSLAPSDDVGLAAAFVHAGFRRTGVLASHLVVSGERKDAIVWSRKLANPSGD